MEDLYVKLESVTIANAHDTIKPSGPFEDTRPGDLVAVRPCADRYHGRTLLGMYLCAAPTSVVGRQEGSTVVLEMVNYTNPAIYIPEIDEIVWGYGSWWGKIESEDQLRQITDDDIANVWYVKALEQLENERKASKEID